MVGRQDTVQNDNNYIYLIGSDKISKDLHVISEQVNKKHINFRLIIPIIKKTTPIAFIIAQIIIILPRRIFLLFFILRVT